MGKRKFEESIYLERPVELPSEEVFCFNSILDKRNDEQAKKKLLEELTLQLNNLIQMFNNKKLTIQNVWENEAVDLFFQFSQNVKENNIDYRFVGQSIEALTKVYVLRLDSLYQDVVQFSSFVAIKDDAKRRRKNVENAVDEKTKSTKVPLRALTSRIVKQMATISKNPEALNAKLQTRPRLDPFFEKLNASLGDFTRPNRMLLYLLPSRVHSKIKDHGSRLLLNSPCWNSNDQSFDKFSLRQQKQEESDQRINLEVTPDIRCSFIRISNADYKLSEESFDNDRITSLVDLTSDTDSVADEITYQYNNDLDFSKEEMFDFKAHEGIKVKTAYDVTNLSHLDKGFTTNQSELITEPDIMQSEYVYHPFSFIKNLHAGPPHWKLLKSHVKIKDRLCPLKKRLKALNRLTTIEDVRDFSDERIVRDNSKILIRKHPRKQLCLPPDFKIASNVFDSFYNSSFSINETTMNYVSASNDESVDENSQGFSGSLDNIFASTFINHDSMNEDESDKENNQPDFNSTFFNFSPIRMTSNHQSKNLTFSTKSQIFNIEKIKNLSLSVVDVNSQQGEVKTNFSSVYKKVSKMFEFRDDSPSCSLTFFSILQAANEGKVEIYQEVDDSLNDFTIESISPEQMSF